MIAAVLTLCVSFCTTITVYSRILSEESVAAIDRAKMEFRKAFNIVRESEATGLDESRLRVLAERLNLIIWMIDRAERLSLHGDPQEAIAQANRSVEFSNAAVSEAVALRRHTPEQISYEWIVRFAAAALISLLPAAGTYYGYRHRRNGSFVDLE
jgi:hypothetical protein